MKSVITIFFSILLLSSCVLDYTHQEVVSENESLKSEIYELKFGLPKLFKDVYELYELKEFSKSKDKINELIELYPNSTEATNVAQLIPIIDEELLWDRVITFESIELVEEYITNYPKGTYSKEVVQRKNAIITKMDKDAFDKSSSIADYNSYLSNFKNGKYRYKAKQEISRIKKLNEKSAYEEAKRSNSIYAWNNFLEEYPNHWDRVNIKKKLITLEVDKIMGNKKTGQLPSFSQTNYGYSSTSSVKIKNDTQYKLTVRYSGPSVKMIEIPVGGTRSTTLTSGSYKIAASAGGLNYGGRENLSGDYSSSYYISTSRY